MCDSSDDGDDFSVLDSLSVVSSSAALDAAKQLLQRGLGRGRLAETVEKHELDVQQVSPAGSRATVQPCRAMIQALRRSC